MKPGLYHTEFLGTPYPIRYITDKATAYATLTRLMNQPVELYALDTETMIDDTYRSDIRAGLNPYLSKTRLLQIFTSRTALVFDCLLIDDYSLFKPFLEWGHFTGHNSIFDLQYLLKYFSVEHINLGCTYLLAKLLFHATRPTDEGLSASLRNLVNSAFGAELLKEVQLSDWSSPELTFEQVEYAALDTIATYRLAERLAPKLEKYGLERVYKLYKDSQLPLARLQLNGIRLDIDRHRDCIQDWRRDAFRAKKNLMKLTGVELVTPTTIAHYLNKTLPPEVLSIWPRTETGKLATDAHVFADFDHIDIVKPFSEYQKYEKLCTAFGSSLINMVNPKTHRLHASYKLAGARTGRLSCSQPNLQQLPRDSSVRQNFTPEDDKVFFRADYSQIEIRVAAEISRDEVMLKAYRDGVDLHKLTASLVSKKPINEVSDDDRQKAKAFNFGLLFGLGAAKFSHYAKKSYGATVSTREAEEGVKTFRTTYAGYRKWQEAQSKGAAQRGYVTTPCGKRRSLDPENSYGASMNTPVQGGASECMLHALIRLDRHLTRPRSIGKIVNVVHDEVVVEGLPEDSCAIKLAIETSMRQGFLDVFPEGITRGIVEVGRGKNWAESKKWT